MAWSATPCPLWLSVFPAGALCAARLWESVWSAAHLGGGGLGDGGADMPPHVGCWCPGLFGEEKTERS